MGLLAALLLGLGAAGWPSLSPTTASDSLGTTGTLADQPPSPTGVTKIMATGDSNIQGHPSTSLNGPRLKLTQDLTAAGFTYDMVGSLVDGSAELADKEHEGHGNYTIDDIRAIMPDRLATYTPQIVLLMIGSKDIVDSNDVANAPTRLGQLLDTILAQPSAERIIVSTIPPFNVDWPEGNQNVVNYNAAMPGLVASRPKVTLVDLHSQIVPATDMVDAVHLNTSGATKLGTLFANAILAGAPPPPPPPPPPDIWMQASSTSMRIPLGHSDSTTLTLFSLNGFEGTISLSVSIAAVNVPPLLPTIYPDAWTDPASVFLTSGGSAASTLYVSASLLTTPGTYSVTVTATSGSIVHSVTISVEIVLI